MLHSHRKELNRKSEGLKRTNSLNMREKKKSYLQISGSINVSSKGRTAADSETEGVLGCWVINCDICAWELNGGVHTLMRTLLCCQCYYS